MSKPHIYVRCIDGAVEFYWRYKRAMFRPTSYRHRKDCNDVRNWTREIRRGGCRGWYGNAGLNEPRADVGGQDRGH